MESAVVDKNVTCMNYAACRSDLSAGPFTEDRVAALANEGVQVDVFIIPVSEAENAAHFSQLSQ